MYVYVHTDRYKQTYLRVRVCLKVGLRVNVHDRREHKRQGLARARLGDIDAVPAR